MLIESKYSIGQTVYKGEHQIVVDSVICEICDGVGRVALIYKGEPLEAQCSKCKGRGSLEEGRSILTSVRTLTIGSVRYDSYLDEWHKKAGHCHFTYMTEQTGVGSGNVFQEKDLYLTEKEAIEQAEIDGALAYAQRLQAESV